MMTETVGILSILEGTLATEGLRLWKLFEEQYASKGVQTFDYPNITFQGGVCQDMAAVKDAMVDLSHRLPPVTVTIDGLGYFDSTENVIFLNVLVTDALRVVNGLVDEMLIGCCERVFDLYRPDRWRPHVTVAMTDLTDENFARAWEDLRDYHPHYQQTLTNICLVRVEQSTGRIEIVHREPLA